MKKIAQPIKLILVLALSCVSWLSLITWVAAQSPPKLRLKAVRLVLPPLPPGPPPAIKRSVRLVLPSLPPGPPPGGRIRGGARRGSCPTVETDLTALVPTTQTDPTVVNVWGLTTMEHPTLWVYVPYTKNSAYPAEFVLLDEESNPVYQKAIALPDVPGVIGVPLGATTPPLVVGKRYRWFFNVYCNQQKSSTTIYVEGVIQRVTLDQATTQQLQTAQPEQRIAIYANNGIWYDALTTVAQLRQQNPQDETLQTEWRDLLETIDMDEVVEKPLVLNK